jgi:hypothetical protein
MKYDLSLMQFILESYSWLKSFISGSVFLVFNFVGF